MRNKEQLLTTLSDKTSLSTFEIEKILYCFTIMTGYAVIDKKAMPDCIGYYMYRDQIDSDTTLRQAWDKTVSLSGIYDDSLFKEYLNFKIGAIARGGVTEGQFGQIFDYLECNDYGIIAFHDVIGQVSQAINFIGFLHKEQNHRHIDAAVPCFKQAALSVKALSL